MRVMPQCRKMIILSVRVRRAVRASVRGSQQGSAMIYAPWELHRLQSEIVMEAVRSIDGYLDGCRGGCLGDSWLPGLSETMQPAPS